MQSAGTCSGAIKWRINGAGLATTTAPSPRSSPKSSPACCLRPLHPFPTDRIETVRSRKTIYVRFDLNDYSIPPEAVGRQLTLGGFRHSGAHPRWLSRDRPPSPHLRPPPTGARSRLIRKRCSRSSARRSTPRPAAVWSKPSPESKTLLDLAFAQGESAGTQTAQLMKLLEQYGAAALRRAIVEALERNTPRASSVAFLLRRQPRSRTAWPRSQPPSASPIARCPASRSGDLR